MKRSKPHKRDGLAAGMERGARRPDLRPPTALTPRARAFWERLVPAQVNTEGRLAVLRIAIESLDRHDRARAIIQREGMVIKSKRGQMSHAHPLLKVEQECRRAFIRCWRQLRLRWNPSWEHSVWPPEKIDMGVVSNEDVSEMCSDSTGLG